MTAQESYLTDMREYHREQFAAEARGLVEDLKRVLDRAEKGEGYDIGSNMVAAMAELVARSNMMWGIQRGITEVRSMEKAVGQ
jgi:hypothetical protein